MAQKEGRGRKEGKFAEPVRLVHYEVYQRGSNESSFLGIVTDKEENQGYAEFYDLQVSEHPSYFVEGIPVHNCHKLTGDAQDALLKVLDDAPSHCYFFLATTSPQKLISTLKTRATEIKVQPLSAPNLLRTMRETLDRAKIKHPTDEVLKAVAEAAEGSARKSLVILNQIKDLPTEEEQLEAILSSDARKEAILIARALMNPKVRWEDLAKIISAVEEDAEKIRKMMLTYMTSAVLKGGGRVDRAMQIINSFSSHWNDCGRAGLVLACYECCKK